MASNTSSTPLGEVKETLSEFQWTIPNFLSLSKTTYYSRSVSFAGASWNFFIYPSGVSDLSDGYISMCLGREAPVTPNTLKVSFAIKTSDGKKGQKRKYARHFFRDGWDLHTLHHWISRDELLKRASKLLPSNVLTVLCSLEYLEATEDARDNETAECSYCEFIADAETISFHKQKCFGRPIKCRECSEVVFLINWFEHECQLARTKGDDETTECSHWEGMPKLCRYIYDSEDISSLIKCPECSDVFTFSRWIQHDCPLATANDYSETAECSYCEEVVDAEDIYFHEKKCVEKPIKCPECSEVVALRNWYEHECKLARTKGEPCTSALSVVLPEKKLQLDLKDLFLNKEDCDVVLKVKGEEFLAHKNILKARSSVFKSTFRTDMKEKATGVVEIEDCDPSCFSNFLCFLYCGDEGEISKENVFSLFTVADKYDVQDLREKCMTLMKENLSVDTFCDTISLALQHSETELIKLSTEFFTKNAPKIIVTAKWQVFSAENPTKSNELFVKLLVPDASVSK